jgi:thiol:disulfide interchange protein
MKTQVQVLAAVCVPWFACVAAAQPAPAVRVWAEPGVGAVRPGEVVPIALVLDHASGYHTWPSEAQDVLPAEIAEFAIRTRIEPGPLPRGVRALGIVQWPQPEPAEVPDPSGAGSSVRVPVYSGAAAAYVPVRVADDAPAGPIVLTFEVTYQACDEMICLLPETVEVSVTIEVDPAAPGVAGRDLPALFAGYRADAVDAAPPRAGGAGPDGARAPSQPDFFGLAIRGGLVVSAVLAVLGGLILNLTPCVLPVIPIKVLTLSRHAGEDRARTLVLGTWMALGVVAFWLAAGIPMAFVSQTLDPSRLIFGYWWVTLCLGLLIALMGLGIMGLFTINLPQAVYAVNPRADSPWGSFVFGVMTAVLGLPCFGFVAGALLAGASTMPAGAIMTVFGGLGVGMALPYFVLSAFPRLVHRIPRTGPASELVKQVMGLLMLAAAAYFCSVGLYALVQEQPWQATNLKWWSPTFFVGIAGLWLVARTFRITRRPGRRGVVLAAGALAVAAMGWFSADSTRRARAEHEARAPAVEPDDVVAGAWNVYSPARMARALSEGKVVVVDFTAEWCINCKVYRRAVLERDPVASRLSRPDVVVLEADLTSRKAPGNDLIRALGQTGIPLLAIYGPGIDEPMLSNNADGGEVVRRIDLAAGG